MTQATVSAPEAPVRGRGRPQSFPNVKTTQRLYTLPLETVAMIDALSEKRGVAKNAVVDAMIRRAFKDMTRSK